MPIRKRLGNILGHRGRSKSPRATGSSETTVEPIENSQVLPTPNLGQHEGQHLSAKHHQNAQALTPTKQTQPPTTSSPAIKTVDPSDCWGRAFQRLESEQPKLFEFYVRQLGEDGQVLGHSIQQLQHLVESKTSDRETKQLVLSLQGKDIKVREYGEKIIKSTIWSTDLVAAATAAQPYAAIAMAGVSILFPLMLQPSAETSQMLKGLEHVSSIVKLYELREKLYLNVPGAHSNQVRDAITNLYLCVLVYEATMLRHLSHNTVGRGTSSVFNPDRWKDLIDAIDKAAGVCANFEQYIDTVEERRLQQEQLSQLQRSYEALKAVKDSVDAMQNQKLKASEHADRLAFLAAFSSPYSRDKNRNPRRVPGTCEWFLQSDLFRNWRDIPTSHLLWLSADPGCGKSVLTRCLIDENKIGSNVLTTSVCYFFFKDDDERRKLASNALTAIIHQLVVQNPFLLEYAMDPFTKYQESLTTDFSQLWEILLEMSKDPRTGSVVCLLDAFDECEEESREELVNALTDFYQRSAKLGAPRIKFLVTSRPYPVIKASFRTVATSVDFVHFDGDARSDQIRQEIDLVIDHQIPQIASQLSEADQIDVSEQLKAMENRTYLWAHLILDLIKKRVAAFPTASRIRDGILRNIPTSLYDIYEDILSRIPVEERDRARVMFQITLAAKRPLSPMELVTALETFLRDDAQTSDDLDLPPEHGCVSMVRDLCGLFLDVRDGFIVFLHQTAREFLINDASNTTPSNGVMARRIRWQHSMKMDENDLTMAIACMRLLNFTEFRQRPPWLEPERKIDPDVSTMQRAHLPVYKDKLDLHLLSAYFLLLYSARNWYAHFRVLDFDIVSSPLEKLSGSTPLFYARMLFQCNSHMFTTWTTLAQDEIVSMWDLCHDSKRDNEIVVACRLNIPNVCESLLYEDLITKPAGGGYLVRVTDEDEIRRRASFGFKKRPLHVACERSDMSIIDMLIRAGADMDEVIYPYSADPYSALSLACGYGRLDVVRNLIERGAKTTGTDQEAPFTVAQAAGDRHTPVVNYLLVSSSFSTHELGDILFRAIDDTDIPLLDKLLEAGVDINFDYNGDYAIFVALAYDRFVVLNWLVSKGATLDIADQYGHNVLWHAIEEKPPSSVYGVMFPVRIETACGMRRLQWALDLGAKINEPDRDAQITFLADQDWNMSTWNYKHWYAFRNMRYSNALQQGIRQCREDIVAMLLEYGASPNLPNCFGETPLLLAEEYLEWRRRYEEQEQGLKSSSEIDTCEQIVELLRKHGATRYAVGSDEVLLSLGPGTAKLLDLDQRKAESYLYDWDDRKWIEIGCEGQSDSGKAQSIRSSRAVSWEEWHRDPNDIFDDDLDHKWSEAYPVRRMTL